MVIAALKHAASSPALSQDIDPGCFFDRRFFLLPSRPPAGTIYASGAGDVSPVATRMKEVNRKMRAFHPNTKPTRSRYPGCGRPRLGKRCDGDQNCDESSGREGQVRRAGAELI